MRSLKSPEIDPIDFDRLRIELLKPEPVYVYRRQLEPIPNQQNNGEFLKCFEFEKNNQCKMSKKGRITIGLL